MKHIFSPIECIILKHRIRRKHIMNKPLIWAHRGASGYAPENTLPAFKLAAEQGADGVELDVQLTKDGEIVVCHDETIDRTSSQKGLVVDYTLEELKSFDFSNGNSAYEGVQIPTMREVFELLVPTSLTINIELKTGIIFYDIEKKIVDLAEECGFKDRVIYSSFNHASVMKIRKYDPNAYIGLLYSDGPVDMPAYAKSHGANALHPAGYNLRYPNYMEECAENGLDVNVWTINRKRDILECIERGVHAIITNYPDKVKKITESV